MFIDNSYKQGLLYETAPSPRPDSFWVGAFFIMLPGVQKPLSLHGLPPYQTGPA